MTHPDWDVGSLEEYIQNLDYRAPPSANSAPAMPVIAAAKHPSRQARRAQHRELLKPPRLPFAVAVTKMLSRKEALRIPEAMEATKKEHARLAARCWNERDRRSKDDVIREARAEGRKVQFSMVYGIIVEKRPGDPRRKCKGRAVLLGNKVFTQD